MRLGRVNRTAHCLRNELLRRVLGVVLEMLRDRGYEHLQACQTVAEVVQNMEDNAHIVFGSKGETTLAVFFYGDERVGVKQLRQWVESSVADRLIVLSLDGPTAFTKREAEHHHPQVQFFTYEQLCVNITRHSLVSKHERIDALPAQLEPSALPVLYTTDRVAQYYAFEPGDLVRITRTAGVQEPCYYYRRVQVP